MGWFFVLDVDSSQEAVGHCNSRDGGKRGLGSSCSCYTITSSMWYPDFGRQRRTEACTISTAISVFFVHPVVTSRNHVIFDCFTFEAASFHNSLVPPPDGHRNDGNGYGHLHRRLRRLRIRGSCLNTILCFWVCDA